VQAAPDGYVILTALAPDPHDYRERKNMCQEKFNILPGTNVIKGVPRNYLTNGAVDNNVQQFL
jgi:hypothetical protein